MSYSIYDIKTLKHPDGRVEVIPCDDSLKLILSELPVMGLTLPIKDDEWELVEEHLEDLDIEIGQVEGEGIHPTPEYNDRTSRAVDEFFMSLGDADFINYDEVNRRLKELMDKYRKDGIFVSDIEKWQPPIVKKTTGEGMKRRY